MKIHRSLAVALLAAGLALPRALPASDIRLPSPRVDWRSLETESFRIVGDVSARRMGEIGRALERFRAALQLLKPTANAASPVPTLVLAFSSDRIFRPYGGVGLEPGREVAGVFHRTQWGNYIVFNASANGEDPLSVVHHEYVHFFVDTNFPSTPLWLNEGLAEYFSTFRSDADSIQVGRPVRSHVYQLRDGWRLPLARLLTVGPSDPEYREGDKVGPFYAQSWLLVHYALVGEPTMAPRLLDLLARLERGEALESAFPAAFGMGFAELENRLREYVRQPAFVYQTVATGSLRTPTVGEPTEIPRAEALTLLGEYLAHAGAADAAREHLAAAAELDAKSGDMVALQAFLESEAGDAARASELYARAAGLSIRRASSAAHAARFALDRASEVTDPEDQGAELEAARRAAMRAIEVDPGYGEPWLLRGLVELRTGDPISALVSFSEAQRRLPERADVVYDRFLASVEAGQDVVARGIASGPLRRLDPELAAEALGHLEERRVQHLLEAAIAESNRLLEAGDIEAAAGPLRAVIGQVPDAGERSRLEAHVASLERQAVEKRRVDQYNRAVGLANAGSHREAKSVLDSLLTDCDDDQVCEAAREFRSRLIQFLGRNR